MFVGGVQGNSAAGFFTQDFCLPSTGTPPIERLAHLRHTALRKSVTNADGNRDSCCLCNTDSHGNRNCNSDGHGHGHGYSNCNRNDRAAADTDTQASSHATASGLTLIDRIIDS